MSFLLPALRLNSGKPFNLKLNACLNDLNTSVLEVCSNGTFQLKVLGNQPKKDIEMIRGGYCWGLAKDFGAYRLTRTRGDKGVLFVMIQAFKLGLGDEGHIYIYILYIYIHIHIYIYAHPPSMTRADRSSHGGGGA